jgi:hypothetical protein
MAGCSIDVIAHHTPCPGVQIARDSPAHDPEADDADGSLAGY